MKRLYRFILVLTSVYLGRVIYVVIKYITHPEEYIYYSAPWYTDLLVEGLFFLFIIVIVLIIAWILKWKSQKNKS